MNPRLRILQSYLLDARRLLARTRAAQGACQMGIRGAIQTLQEELHTWKGTSGMVEEGAPIFSALHAAETAIEKELPRISAETHALLERTWAWSERYLALQEEKVTLWKTLGLETSSHLGILVEVSASPDPGLVWIPMTQVIGLWVAGEVSPHEWDDYVEGAAQNTTDRVGLGTEQGTLLLGVAGVLGLMSEAEAKLQGADCVWIQELGARLATRRRGRSAA